MRACAGRPVIDFQGSHCHVVVRNIILLVQDCKQLLLAPPHTVFSFSEQREEMHAGKKHRAQAGDTRSVFVMHSVGRRRMLTGTRA